MQFRLRTLLIVLAIGPPVVAVVWWFGGEMLPAAGMIASVAIPFAVLMALIDWLDPGTVE